MRVETQFHDICSRPSAAFVTERDANELIRAAERDNEKAGGCCSGPGTAGSDRLRDIYLKPENENKFKDLGARATLARYLHLDSQGVSKSSL